ncbi:MAG TPA: DUF1501 domain-containing protein [Planctomycetaceae bacterium]|nr:DUF1501 domain-containing protein [Planctomycetaceae bacterium]
MLTVLGSPRRCCDGLTRRETLKVGALSALGGFGLPELLAAGEAGHVGPGRGRAKSVILLYLLGGAATQDMFDLKPGAPAEIRGEFRPIGTTAAGVEICEHLPLTARWMHRAAIVRSVHHQAGCHNTLPGYTGHELPLDNITITRDTYPPSMGSVCEYIEQRSRGRFAGRAKLPAYVYMPCYLGWGQAIRRPGPYGGFLGRQFDALTTECQPQLAEGAPVPVPGQPQVALGAPLLPQSALQPGLTLDRLDARRTLLEQLDDEHRRLEVRRAAGAFERQQERAFDVLTSSELKAAFDLAGEDPARLERYGRTLFGQSTLTARRLVEAGVRFVNVTWDLFWDRVKIDYDAWDTHTNNFGILRGNKLPGLDQTFSALLEDLDGRGLLDETLVLVMSEMGRTPRINGNAGRDHWTSCYSVLFAGAGIRGGTVHGSSDSQAAYVKDHPVSTSDVCATVYHALGIDPAFRVPDHFGRPVEIAHGGEPIREILA